MSLPKISDVPKMPNPRLVDKVIVDLQDGLKANLSWLNYSFGRAQVLTKIENKKKVKTPNIYIGDQPEYIRDTNDYIQVIPDDIIQNYSFFLVEDPQEYVRQANIQGQLIYDVSLIFWFDLRRVFDSKTNRNTEELKSEILKLLNGGIWMKYGRVSVEKIYEGAENVFDGFTLDETTNQYLMHPYAGMRFKLKIIVNETCYN